MKECSVFLCTEPFESGHDNLLGSGFHFQDCHKQSQEGVVFFRLQDY